MYCYHDNKYFFSNYNEIIQGCEILSCSYLNQDKPLNALVYHPTLGGSSSTFHPQALLQNLCYLQVLCCNRVTLSGPHQT